MNLNKLVQAAIFTAMAIGLGFMFMLVPNLEFISVTVFLAGYTLGKKYGIMVGASAIFIYSAMNPLGSGLIYFTLLLGQLVAMGIVGFLGAVSVSLLPNNSRSMLVALSAGFGFFVAFIYDSITTLAYPVSAGYSWEETIAYAISGLAFTFMHLVSNAAIFSIVVPGYIKRKLS